jgi:hypothetical protein
MSSHGKSLQQPSSGCPLRPCGVTGGLCPEGGHLCVSVGVKELDLKQHLLMGGVQIA